MTELVQQRYRYDCTVCCLAMLTGLEYEEILIGLPDYVERHTPAEAPKTKRTGMSDHDVHGFFRWLGWPRARYEMFGDHQRSADAMRALCFGRRALLSVRSLNLDGGYHSIYWDGARVFDPSPGQTYRFWSAVVPSTVWLFADTPRPLHLSDEQLASLRGRPKLVPSERHAAKTRAEYERLIEPLREVARERGYALTLHGTLARDIDLVAVPWVTEASPPRELAEALQARAAALNDGYAEEIDHRSAANPDYFFEGCPGGKPHGRLCWSFHLGGGPYLDLSVMPPRSPDE